MATQNYTAIVVSETHWDRAWYLPFQSFRIRLVKLIDELLTLLESSEDFRHFVLDGQTVVLEDYLEIRPENAERIRNFVMNGRLLVGPWYVLPDEFLVSPEALIRNLMLGHKLARQFGRVMKVGYVPDPFGHISQMPQILNGFDIDNFIFTRGMGPELERTGTEFYWEGADGTSRVLAINQADSYCNAANLSVVRENGETRSDIEAGAKQAEAVARRLIPRANTNYVLLNNGCDHLPPEKELPAILRRANTISPDIFFLHGTYQDYIDAIKKAAPNLRVVRGELRSGTYHPLLSGVLSSRMYLKQQNTECQTILEKWAEPFSALAWLRGAEYPSALLWLAWKYLLKNHPHDDICGCSVDEVHQDNVYRFRQARIIGNELLNRALRALASHVTVPVTSKDSSSVPITIWNPSSWERDDVVLMEVPPALEGKTSVIAKTLSGEILPTQLISNGKELAVLARGVPALGYQAVVLTEGEPTAPEAPVVVKKNSMENEYVVVKFAANGTLSVSWRDGRHRRTYKRWMLFEDREDTGDEYDWSPLPKSPKPITSSRAKAKIEIVEKGPIVGTFRVTVELKLPEALGKDRKKRSRTTTPCTIETLVTLRAGSPRIDFMTNICNQARDHRLRVLFPTSIYCKEAHAEGHFDVISRKLKLPKGDKWVQPPLPTAPQRRFVDISDGRAGVAMINYGLPEYEVITEGRNRTLALTLLRCVGRLSGDDLQTRKGHAGPGLPTPEAQCQGQWSFEYALLPHQKDWEEALVWREAESHNVPLRAWPATSGNGSLPAAMSFVSVSPETVTVSSVKKAEQDDALIVRLFNYGTKAVTAGIAFPSPITDAMATNLNEEPRNDPTLVREGNRLSISLNRFEVKTLLVKFG